MKESLEKSVEYYLGKNFPRLEPVPEPEDLMPDVLEQLRGILSRLKSIKIPAPKDFSPDISTSSKSIVAAVKSINIPTPPSTATIEKLQKDMLASIDNLKAILSDKSSILSLSRSIGDSSEKHNKIGEAIIAELKRNQAEIQSTNSITSKSASSIESIILELKAMDNSKALVEVAATRALQDKTNRLISDEMKTVLLSVSRKRNYEFDLQRDENGFLRKIIAVEI